MQAAISMKKQQRNMHGVQKVASKVEGSACHGAGYFDSSVGVSASSSEEFLLISWNQARSLHKSSLPDLREQSRMFAP